MGEANNTVTVAAIWYECDQNEPSHPFILDLSCPLGPDGDPTLEQLTTALGDWYYQEYLAQRQRLAEQNLLDLDDEDVAVMRSRAEVVIKTNPPWGHIQVGDGEVAFPILFASVRPDLARRLGLAR